MTNNIKFKEIDASTINECVDIYIKTFSSEPWNDVIDSKEPVKSLFLNHFNNNYCISYGAYDEDTLIGLCVGFKKPWIEGLEYYVDQLCILPSHQNHGIGSTFMTFISSDIKSKGMNAIMLNTEKGFPSERFYINNDFIPLVDILLLAKMV